MPAKQAHAYARMACEWLAKHATAYRRQLTQAVADPSKVQLANDEAVQTDLAKLNHMILQEQQACCVATADVATLLMAVLVCMALNAWPNYMIKHMRLPAPVQLVNTCLGYVQWLLQAVVR